MKIPVQSVKRFSYGLAALAVSLGVALPLFAGQAHAYDIVTNRNIRMSSSAIGSITAGQNVSYEIDFDVKTAGAVQAVVVDFCSNSPLPGTACTAPTGFTVGAGTTTGSIAGMSGTWSGASANSGRTLNISLGTPSGSASASAAATFTLTTATNPTSAVGTFYARIFTFASAANATTWLSTADGSATATVVDAGGVAMSTASQVTMTAKIQESLTFCVYTGANCGAGGTAVTLGDTNGVLSTAGPFVDKNTKYDIATNANGNAVVRFKAGLPTSGGNTIATIGTTATASSAGTSQFGICTYQATGSGLTATAPYNHANCSSTTQTAGTGSTGGVGTSQFAFDTTPAATTYGDDLASKTPGSTSQGVIPMVGNIATTQQAGIYVNTFTLIATGTY